MGALADGKTQVHAVRLQLERARLLEGLKAREARQRRQLELPVEGLRTRVRFLETSLSRVTEHVSSLEHALEHEAGRAVRVGRLMTGVGRAVAAVTLVVGWAVGAWIVTFVVHWPPSMAVALSALPTLGLAARVRRTFR